MPTDDPGRQGNRTPPLPDEAEVVARATAGDRGAFAQLMEHYQSAGYAKCSWKSCCSYEIMVIRK